MKLIKPISILLAGALLPLAFAPIHFWVLSFLSPAVLLYACLHSTPRQSFIQGLLFGIGLFSVGSSWIFISIHRFGGASVPLACFITALFILTLALYPATQGWLLRQFWQKKSNTLICLAAFPTTWTIFEYIRGHLFDGFPFLFLGYSQVHSPLAGFAPIIGVYGISLLVTFIAGGLCLLATQQAQRTKARTALAILLILIAGFALSQFKWTHPIGQPIKTALIQGNIPQSSKWDTNQLYTILNKYYHLTELAKGNQLIIWPEAAVPYYPSELPYYFQQLQSLTLQQGSTLAIGAPTLNPNNKQQVYNSLILLGKDQGQYNKQHLVPFGEYIPLPGIFGRLINAFHIPMSSLTPGSTQQHPLNIHGIPTAAFICYETAFSQDVLRMMKHKQLAINIVDDAWFGHSFAAAQQFQMTQMRALETGRYFAVAANTGITAIINPHGQIINQLKPNQTAILTSQLRAQAGLTPLQRLGYWPLSILLLTALLIISV
jgi:apolipoprotein N-acyltransferase